MAFMNVRMMMLVLLAVAATVAKPAVAQLPGLPGGDGVCPLPFDFLVDFSDTGLTGVDVPGACSADGFDCYECGCAIAAQIVAASLQGGFVTEEELATDVDAVVNNMLACALQLLPQLDAVGLQLPTLLPLLACEPLTESADVCVEALLLQGAMYRRTRCSCT